MEEQKPRKVVLTDLIPSAAPIVEVVFPDDGRVRVGPGPEDFDQIIPYPEHNGGQAPNIWLSCFRDGHLVLRLNTLHVAGVIHGTLSEEDREKLESHQRATALEELQAKNADGTFRHPVEELREIAGSAARPEPVRQAAQEALRARGAAGPVEVK